MKPKVSVIIPAYNEEKVIQQCLQSLVDQTFESYEVIIIDDASTDQTKSIIQGFVSQYPDQIKLREYGKVGPGKARNLTAYQSDAEFLVFTDADCYAEPDWIGQIIGSFISDEIGSVGGPHFAPPDSSPFQMKLESFFKSLPSAIDFYKGSSSETRETNHNPLCNVAYRRDIFMRLRGFREDLFPGEDVELDQRVIREGYRILYNPQAIVYHHRPENVSQWRKVMFAYGRAQGKLLRENGLSRRIQAIGILSLFALLALCWGLINSLSITGMIASALLVVLFFSFRPRWNNYFGIFCNAFEWFNGFLYGFWTKRSDPPGTPPKTE